MGKKILIGFGVIVLLVICTVGGFYGMYIRPFMQKMDEVKTVQYDKQLTLVFGEGGGNSGILVSDSVVLVIDSKMNKGALEFYDTVKQIAGNKPIILVNTHIHIDHTGGNKYLSYFIVTNISHI